MNILILGGTGFIGPYVVRRLVELGHAVTLYHRGRTEADLPAAIQHLHAPGFTRDLPRQAATLARLAPEVVLYMVPHGEEDTRLVVDAVTGVARRLVALSSVDVYRAYGRVIGTEPGPPDPEPLTEDAPLRERLYPFRDMAAPGSGAGERSPDTYEKILAERLVMGAANLPGTVLRLPMVYGPGDYQHRLFPYLKRMDDGRPAIVLDEGLAAFRAPRGYVENVAAAIALAVVDDRAAGRVFNVGEPESLSEAEWARRIAVAAGWQGRLVTVPRERLPETLRPRMNTDQDWALDTGRIREELGYQEPVAQAEGVRRAVAWERQHPPATIPPEEFDYAAEDAALATQD